MRRGVLILDTIGELIINGLKATATINAVFYICAGTLMGLIVGIIPGFQSAMAVAILLPLTLFMGPFESMVFLISIYIADIYGGSITATIINIPGTGASVATTLDGYPMTQKGECARALGIVFGSSFFSGIIAYIFMLFVMLPIARFAIRFGPPELFLLGIWGITMLSSVSSGDMRKTLIAGLFGLAIGSIGVTATGEWRANFGSLYLIEGVNFIPAIIGLYAVSEVISMSERKFIVRDRLPEIPKLSNVLKGLFEPFKNIGVFLRSTIIGTIIGAIPAAGGTIGSLVAYGDARSRDSKPELFGTGYAPGIIAPESANNASTGGALITTFSLGIPGSATTAVLIGALMIQGLRPGPQLLREQIGLVYAIIVAAIIAQIFMLFFSIIIGYKVVGILGIPTQILVPLISVFCMFGTFAIRNAMFDVYLMIAFGLIGWLMKRNGYPPVAIVLGIVLGPMIDSEFIRTITLWPDNWMITIFTRPISIFIFILIAISLITPILKKRNKNKNNITNKILPDIDLSED